jgi:hypothetical protein
MIIAINDIVNSRPVSSAYLPLPKIERVSVKEI